MGAKMTKKCYRNSENKHSKNMINVCESISKVKFAV